MKIVKSDCYQVPLMDINIIITKNNLVEKQLRYKCSNTIKRNMPSIYIRWQLIIVVDRYSKKICRKITKQMKKSEDTKRYIGSTI